MRFLCFILIFVVFWFFSAVTLGKTFCPACPQEKYVPSGMELEKIRVEKEVVNGEAKIRITLQDDGIFQEVAVFFFDPEDFVSQRVRVFLEELKERYPDLRIVEGNIQEERVKAIKEALDSLFGVPKEKRGKAPCLFIKGKALVGEREIIAGVEKTLSEYNVEKEKPRDDKAIPWDFSFSTLLAITTSR